MFRKWNHSSSLQPPYFKGLQGIAERLAHSGLIALTRRRMSDYGLEALRLKPPVNAG